MADFATLYLQLKNSAFNTGLDKSSMKLKAIGSQALRAGAMLSAISIPAGLATRRMINSFSNFDNAMQESMSIMGNLTAQQERDMTALAKSISTQLPMSAEEAAKSYFFLASAGLNAEQSLKALPVVAKFATAGAFDMAKATDLLTDAQSALGLSSKDAQTSMNNMIRLSDLFVKSNTLANTSVQQLSEAITSDAGSTIKQYNLNLEDSIATLSAYADQGKKGAEAGNLFGRATRLLISAQQENSAEFKRLGINVFDANGQMNTFAVITSQMEKALMKLTPEARASQLSLLGFNALAQKAILPLVGASKAIEGYTANLRQAGGITDEIVNKQMRSFSKQVKLLTNYINIFAIELAQSIAPVLSSIVGVVKNVVKWFRDLSSTTKAVIATAIIVVAALGPVILLFGGLAYAIGVVLPFLPAIAAGFLAVAKVAAIAAVSFKFLQGFFTAMREDKDIVLLIKDFQGWIKKATEEVNKFIPSMEVLQSYFQSAGILAVAAGKIFYNVFKGLGEIIMEVANANGKNLVSFFSWIYDNSGTLVSNIHKLLIAFGKDIVNLYTGIWENIWSLMSGGEANFTAVFANVGKNLDRELKKLKLPELELVDPLEKAAKIIDKTIEKIGDINKEAQDKILATAKATVSLTEQAKKASDGVQKTPAILESMNSQAQSFTEAAFAGTIEAQKREISKSSNTDKNIEKNTKKTAEQSEKMAKFIEKMANKTQATPIYVMGN